MTACCHSIGWHSSITAFTTLTVLVVVWGLSYDLQQENKENNCKTNHLSRLDQPQLQAGLNLLNMWHGWQQLRVTGLSHIYSMNILSFVERK